VAQFVSYVTENEKYYYIYSVFQVVREGLELPPETPGKTALSETGGTESGTLAAHSLHNWPKLMPTCRW
jgi:hypothetical protein